jgi:ABC-type Fe3+ transport system permease subunit
MKQIAMLLVVLMLAGCATAGAGDGYVRSDGSAVATTQRDEDAKGCRQTGMMIASIPLFLLLVVPGVAMVVAAGSMERSCMAKKGYTPEAEKKQTT